MFPFADRFFAAVRALAGAGPIKKRLIKAYIDNLDNMPKVDIPESIGPQFESLWRELHSAKPMSREDPVVASVRKMSSADAGRCAASIVAMFSELVRDKATGEPLRLPSRTGTDADMLADIARQRVSTLN